MGDQTRGARPAAGLTAEQAEAMRPELELTEEEKARERKRAEVAEKEAARKAEEAKAAARKAKQANAFKGFFAAARKTRGSRARRDRAPAPAALDAAKEEALIAAVAHADADDAAAAVTRRRDMLATWRNARRGVDSSGRWGQRRAPKRAGVTARPPPRTRRSARRWRRPSRRPARRPDRSAAHSSPWIVRPSTRSRPATGSGFSSASISSTVRTSFARFPCPEAGPRTGARACLPGDRDREAPR